MNKVMLIGNVGQDPEVRYVDQGVAVARLRLATTERGYTLQNGTQVPDHTDWHNVVLWRRLAEIVDYHHREEKPQKSQRVDNHPSIRVSFRYSQPNLLRYPKTEFRVR